MATDLGQQRGGKAAGAPRHENFARAQLAKAEARIRSLDLIAALSGFVAGTLGFAMLVMVCDRRWELSTSVRQGAFFFYVAAASVYLIWAVVLPMRRRVNPYYAALKMEETLPEAKNSVINWVDLHEANLAPAITAAVGQRAARDLARADVEQAISGKKAGWAAGITGLIFVLFVAAFILFGPRVFASLFHRLVVPFESGSISKQTHINLVKPEGGDAVLAVGRSATIAVEVTGRLPDPKGPNAVRLLYRYQEADPYIERPLTKEAGEDWTIAVNAFDVQNGFWYKVAGGDAETSEHRITVRSTPLLTDFRATYRFRPYTARPTEVRPDRRLEAVRGTEVTLRVKTNRQVKEAYLDLEAGMAKKALRAERLDSDAQGFQTKFVLDESGSYRLRYTSVDGETYFDPSTFPITASPDKAPVVELTAPGKDTTLPANGMLKLEGAATDDFGVKAMVLKMQLDDGRKLQGKAYRSEKALQLPAGGHPVSVEYKDFVDLGKVVGTDGKPLPLKAGLVLEYWLEATDACDYPQANTGSSKHFRVKLTEPEQNPMEQQKEREKAAEEKKQHDAKQDEQIKKEDKARQDQAKQQEAENKQQDEPMNGDKKPDEKGPGGKQDDKKDPKDGDNPKPNEGDPNEKNGPNDAKNQEIQQKLEDELKKKQDEAKGKENKEPGKENEPKKPDDKANADKPKNQVGKENKGEGKDDPKQKPADGKDGGQKENKPDKADAKVQGPKKDGEKPCDCKGDGNGGKNGQGASKDQGGGEPKPDRKANGKGGEAKPMDGNKPGMGKEEGKGDQAPKPGDNKPGDKAGQPMSNDKASEGKPGGKEQQPAGAGEKKDAGGNGHSADGKPMGDAKNQPGNPEKGEAKNEGPAGKKEAKAEPRDPGMNPMNGQDQPGEEKKDSAKGGRESVAKGQPKGEAEERRNNLPEEAEKLAKLMRDLKSKDPTERERAVEQLKNMTDEQFKQALEAYKDQLDKQNPDGKGRDDKGRDVASAKPKPGKDDVGPDNKPGSDGKGDQGAKENGTAEPKGGKPDKGDMGDGKGPGDGKGGNPDGKPEEGEPAGKSKEKGTGAGTKPGEGQVDGGRAGTGRDGDAQPEALPEPQAAEARFRERAGVLQLEEFKRKVDKKVLKDAQISDEDFAAFLKAYEEMLKRQTAKGGSPEVLPGPQAGITLPSVGARRVAPTGTANDIKNSGRPLPPPRYREAYREFTRQLATPDNKDGK